MLGGFWLQYEEKLLTAKQIRLHKARDLLKLLIMAPEQRLHQEHIMEMLWPERAPPVAAHCLSQTLYVLRSRLVELNPSIHVEHEDECLVLRASGGISSDVGDFEELARSALSHVGPVDSQAAASCQDAILAYSGDLLPEDGPSDLFYQRRDELRQLYLDLLLLLADYHLQAREYLPSIHALKIAITVDPANEEVHTRLMRAYAHNGQRQAALRQYRALEEALWRELEVEPGRASQQLRQRIRDGELDPDTQP